MALPTGKIPATVITGFLGAGKTTVIRNLLQNANGKRIALIINEFGDVGVDGEVLRGCGEELCREEDMVELANGCICCTVADDFVPTMTKLLERDAPPDHIVIETSGLALPQPLVKAFSWPEIGNRVTVDGVVTVIDSAAVAAGRFAPDEDAVQAQRKADPALDHESPLEELFEDQLTCADMVLLNKADLVAEGDFAGVEATVREEVRPGVRLIRTQNGEIGNAVLLGLGAAAEADMAARKSHHEMEGEEDHDHDDFDSFVVSLPGGQDKAELTARIESAITRHDILRLKGFAALAGSGARLVLQAVGPRLNSYFDRPWQPGEARETKLVVIGLKDMDRSAIAAALSDGAA